MAPEGYQPKHAISLIFLAMEEGLLDPYQAMFSCLAIGKSIGEQESFNVKNYWLEQQWLSPEKISRIEQLLLDSPDRTADYPDPEQQTTWLSTIQSALIAQRTQQPLPTPTLDASPQTLGRTQDVITTPYSKRPQERTFTWQPAKETTERYDVVGTLGRGGLGIVDKIFDRNLGREVARKTMIKGSNALPQEQAWFVEEACLTGQLEHPNIIPIYELGQWDEQPFYTMRLITSDTLAQAMSENKLTLIQQVRIIQQVCMGLEYAHSRGVVHRDIKPDNILLGEFGEVLIFDWGVAKNINKPNTHLEHQPPSFETPDQLLKGTPPYMPMELIQQGVVSPALDQYAVGVMLYQILTGKLPYFDTNLFRLLYKICSETPELPSECCPDRSIPEELEQICMKMLSHNPEHRFASCRDVHDQLESFLEGTKERERRALNASTRINEAKQLTSEYQDTIQKASQLRLEWENARKEVESWDPMEKKEALWNKEDAYKKAEQQEVKLFAAVVQKYQQALDHEPGNPVARKGLADVYWERFRQSEQAHNTREEILYKDLMLFYDDGSYEDLLHSRLAFELESEPTQASIQAFRYEETMRRLEPVPNGGEEASPRQEHLDSGSYLFRLSSPGYQTVSYPVHLQRGQSFSGKVKLYTPTEVGEGYIHIPAGEFWFGGDPEAEMSLPLQQVHLDDFFISEHPVTFREYLAFVNDVHRQNPQRAQQLLPHSTQEPYAVLENNRYIPDRSNLFHGTIAERYPAESQGEWEVPVFGVSWYDAVCYCRWLSEQKGRLVTLPSEYQWEKAASGADRRVYPWGNSFDANFCKMGRSRPPKELQPEPIGVFPFDQSPYGMKDVVGTICEWTLSQAQEDVDAMDKDPKLTQIQRGGGWVATNLKALRVRSRVPRPEGLRSYNCGIRTVQYPLQSTRHSSEAS